MRALRLALVLIFAISAFLVPTATAAPAQAAGAETYIVLYKANAVPSDAASVISKAGGTLAYSYGSIGVAIARSSNPGFRANLIKDGRVDGAAATTRFGSALSEKFRVLDKSALPAGWSPNDPLSKYQWDMVQIHVPEAQAALEGKSLRQVVVGDIDTGLDWTHPDLAANVDFSRSVSCIGGVPNQDPAAWMDDNGHGTHTAGTIAAVKGNGIGIAGVAPNAKLAGIKAGNADGFFFPEAVVCSFMWAGTHGIDVTNNSYFADPWLFNCKNDPEQRAIWKAEQRAIRFAQSRGVTVVAAAGNENNDLAHPTVDTISPDNGTPVTRDVTNACVVIPVEIPGVIGVSADASALQKASYSNYGVSAIQVTAPGGDYPFQPTNDGTFGLILSTIPGGRYALAAGTSMASPHVAGVAALVASTLPKASQGRVQAVITSTADHLACPPNPFDPAGDGSTLATCQGNLGYNSFYGHGQANALRAVTGH